MDKSRQQRLRALSTSWRRRSGQTVVILLAALPPRKEDSPSSKYLIRRDTPSWSIQVWLSSALP